MLGGVISPLVTPYGSNYRPDLGAMQELINFAVSRGITAICIGSTTGEFVHYSVEARKQMLACAASRSKVPVIAGVSYPALDGAVDLARAAADSGACALLLMPPYFYRYAQEEVREFFSRFAEERPASLPVLLYNIPAFTTEISTETARILLSSGRFAGIKDSSGSLDYFQRLKALRSQHRLTLLVGDDKIFTEARTQGADGVISGVSGVLPELVIAIDTAVQTGLSSRAQSLDRRLREFIAWLDRFPGPAGLKLALAERGLPAGAETVVLSPERRRLADQFRGWLRDWLPMVLREAALREATG